jgi:hypothetical protein
MNLPTNTFLRIIAGLDPAIYADGPLENSKALFHAARQHGYAA